MIENDTDTLFTTQCNSKTIQSDDGGFFNNIYNVIEENLSQKCWIKKVYGNLSCDKKRFESIFQNEEVSKPLLKIVSRPEFIDHLYFLGILVQ